MIINKLDDIEFRLNSHCDLSWLKKYGTAFTAIDETGSGCILIGMQKGEKRFFCKIAGVDTIDASVSPTESVRILRDAVSIYRDLCHPNLTKIIEHYQYNAFYVVVFEWVDGECLFDHWNFKKYSKDTSLQFPKDKFIELSVEKKLKSVDVIFSFLESAARHGYVAVDFYDGSLMYDFSTDITMICDIDFFRKAPAINDVGESWFGTKRLKAPEEYIKGDVIDEATNVFTVGALIFEFFGKFTDNEIKKRYKQNRFVPCSRRKWQLNNESYFVALKAVNPNRDKRYQTISAFWTDWKNSLYDEPDQCTPISP